MRISRQNKRLLLIALSLFSVVRGYNVLMITLGQYLTAIFIMAPDLPLKSVLFDLSLFLIVTASALTIASGYIINNFYDAEKDLINKPNKVMIDRLVNQKTKLVGYFLLNFAAILAAAYVSFRAVLFFSAYIFGIWFYSHKLKRYPFIGNLVSTTLAITPFFAVFVYYKNFEAVIFVHATFLFLLLLIREMTKDLENLKGDLSHNYQTIPVVYGIRKTKIAISIAVCLLGIPAYLLLQKFDIGHMYLYFYGSLFFLVIYMIWLWRSSKKRDYLWLHNLLKFILVAGVFSIILLDVPLWVLRLF
ncbi:MAG: geranylgeranylglycerol-phosphate geranylgeranyltransferase [Flavobacteriaceae bacterium]|nr:geranylgeranylglycerol-phosphate geranylgeranyltransferase [Flavobacteriaceae bacterium]